MCKLFSVTKFTLRQWNPHLSDEEFDKWINEIESEEIPFVKPMTGETISIPRHFEKSKEENL